MIRIDSLKITDKTTNKIISEITDNVDVIFDYFIVEKIIQRCALDFERIKMHHLIDNVDCHKSAAYLARWISKLSPIAILNKQVYRKPGMNYINQLFAICMGITIVNFEKNERKKIGKGINNFKIKPIELRNILLDLLYTMKYSNINSDLLGIIYYHLDILAGTNIINAS